MRTMASPSAEREEAEFFTTDGLRVRYRDRGDGEPLLLINGIGAPLELWGPLEDRLADFRTITLDAPGAGASSTPRGRFGMRDHAGVLADLLDHVGVASATVLGLSLGGMMAQELAHRHPERVERLILASTSCGVGSTPADPRTLAAIASPVRFFSRRQYERIAPMFYGRQVREDPSLLHAHLEARAHAGTSLRGYYTQFGAACTWSSRSWLETLGMPVLVIAGSADQVVPVDNGHMLASAVADGRLEVIEDGSHMCLIQAADRTSGLIRDFVRTT